MRKTLLAQCPSPQNCIFCPAFLFHRDVASRKFELLHSFRRILFTCTLHVKTIKTVHSKEELPQQMSDSLNILKYYTWNFAIEMENHDGEKAW